MYIYVFVYMYVYMYICMYIYMYVYIYPYICVCTYIFICVCIYTYIYVCLYIHIRPRMKWTFIFGYSFSVSALGLASAWENVYLIPAQKYAWYIYIVSARISVVICTWDMPHSYVRHDQYIHAHTRTRTHTHTYTHTLSLSLSLSLSVSLSLSGEGWGARITQLQRDAQNSCPSKRHEHTRTYT